MNHCMQVEPNTIWCFEQEQALSGINVVTTIRMTAIKLESGELLIYAPIAPTRQAQLPISACLAANASSMHGIAC